MQAMSTKTKTLVAAIAFIGAGAANAAVVLPATYGSGSGLIFEAWDSSTGTSFTQVLGNNTFNSVLYGPGVVGTSTNGQDQVFSLDTSFLTNLGSSTNLRWHVVAAKDVLDNAGTGGTGPNTSLNGVLQTASVTTPPSFNNNATNSATSNTHWNNINNLLGTATFASVVNNPSDPGYAGRSIWAGNFGVGPAPNNAITGFYTGSIDSSTVYGPSTGVGVFWTFLNSGGTGIQQNSKTLAANAQGNASWILQSNGTLTYHVAAAPAVVPIPAAAWLFGSGLLGLVGIARRRKNGQ